MQQKEIATERYPSWHHTAWISVTALEVQQTQRLDSKVTYRSMAQQQAALKYVDKFITVLHVVAKYTTENTQVINKARRAERVNLLCRIRVRNSVGGIHPVVCQPSLWAQKRTSV